VLIEDPLQLGGDVSGIPVLNITSLNHVHQTTVEENGDGRR
jgi:hypothetical protein